MRLHLFYGLASIWLMCWNASGFSLFRRHAEQPDKTADTQGLSLSAAEEAQSQALSNFAWGFFLQLQGEADRAEIMQHYLDALKLKPDSQVVLHFLVTPWAVERDYQSIIDNIRPLAEEHPTILELQLTVAEALAAQNKNEEATAFLEEALQKNDWAAPLIFREVFVSYWRQERYDDMEKLLAKVRRQPGMRDSFAVHQAAALFFADLSSKAEEENDPQKFEQLTQKALGAARHASRLVADALRLADIEALAQLFSAREEWQDLIQLIERAREQEHFATPELNLLLVEGLQQTDRTDEALAILQDIVRTAHFHPRLYISIGRYYLDAEKLNEAAVFYERALNAFPRAVHLYFRLAYIYLRLQEGERAADLLNRLNQLPAEGYFLLAHAYHSQGLKEKAVQALLQAENTAIENENDEFFSMDFFVFWATLLEDLGQTDQSLEVINKALEREPENPICANFLGYVLADHNRELQEAEGWIKLALKAEPDNPAYIDSLAWVYFRQERFSEAMEAINRTLRLIEDEPDPVILDHAGDIYAANNLWLLAQKYWLEALAAGSADEMEILRKLEHVPDAEPKIEKGILRLDNSES